MSTTHLAGDVDAIVVGGGFGGLYATHRLRNILGLRVQAFEAGSGPGGTWYWNRYPGARCDIESITYSYSFDEDLQREWRWTERYAAQPEILAYLDHVADRFDLRRSFEFDTRVTSVVWSETDHLWTVGTDTGRTLTARFVLAASGSLSVAKSNEIPGMDEFQGEVYRTSAWPHQGVDLAGKRVAVVGTGSTGIQLIPEVARVAEHLVVFQRTANFACPLGNAPVADQEWSENVDRYAEIRKRAKETFGGLPNPDAAPSALLVDDAERRSVYDRYYASGGFRLLTSTFNDLLVDKQANDTVADYIRAKIRARVDDPAVAEMLCPGDDHPYGTKRAPFETGYYETFNRANVALVDVRATPIERMTSTGLRTSAGDHEFDVLILATGFDAFTGPLAAMNVVGRDGVRLEEAWATGPRTYLGLAVHGFPNLFTIVGPQSPSVLTNFPVAIEEHVDYVGDAITALIERGAATIEATEEAVRTWTALVRDIADCTLYPQAKSSWYMGANVPGKPRNVLMFVGGLPLYRALCAEVQNSGYGGFAIDGSAREVPGFLELDPTMALVVGGMLAADPRPLDELSLDELRAVMGGAGGPLPVSDSVKLHATTYPSVDGERPVRVYVPSGHEGPLPVVVFLHGGGWISGGIEAVEQPCRSLAEELGAVVVAPSYRLAPEHPFPAAIDDTVAALRWTATVAPDFGADPDRLAVVGESSGGTLAAVAALHLRDVGGPAVAAQVLIYPPIDPDARTASRMRYRTGPILTTAVLDQMWALYLKDPLARQSPLAVPSKATSLKDLPPALIVTVQADPVRDEAEAYARQLADAGTTVEVSRIAGLAHGSLNLSMYVPHAAEILNSVVTFLRGRLVRSDRSQTDAVVAAP